MTIASSVLGPGGGGISLSDSSRVISGPALSGGPWDSSGWNVNVGGASIQGGTETWLLLGLGVLAALVAVRAFKRG